MYFLVPDLPFDKGEKIRVHFRNKKDQTFECRFIDIQLRGEKTLKVKTVCKRKTKALVIVGEFDDRRGKWVFNQDFSLTN